MVGQQKALIVYIGSFRMEREDAVLSEAFKKGALVFEAGWERRYARFREDFKHIPRGTAVIGNRIIYGYPHIKRIFTLEAGLKRNITSNRVALEEKIDGYNVRVVRIGDSVIALSRGGFIDPFATEKVRRRYDPFFKKFPNAVLCGEMVGNTPYTKPAADFDTRLLIFDIGRGDGTYLDQEEKEKILKSYSIEHVPFFGMYPITDIKKIRRVAYGTFKDKKEGIVIKSEDRKQAVKYVNPASDIQDIATNSAFFLDMPTGFYMQRILRSAFFVRDFGLDKDQIGSQLGHAFLDGLAKALNALEAGDPLTEEHEILISDRAVWEKLRAQMRKEVGIEVVFEREETEGIRIRFRKIYRKTTRRLREFLHGHGVED